MSISEVEEEQKFIRHLSEFWASKNITQMKIPQIGRQQLKLYKLYKAVCKRGGGQAVSNNKLWKEIVDEFGLPATCTSASFTLKNHYQKYLLAYEQKYYFGKDDDTELPELVAGRVRRSSRMDDRGMLSRPGFYPIKRGAMPLLREGENQQTQLQHLTSQLQKCYQKCDKSQNIYFIRKEKMYPSPSEIRRIHLGLESGLRDQVTYSLNMLVLYSVNTHTPFTFEQESAFLDQLSSFLENQYPTGGHSVQNILKLERLRTCLLIVRNLAMTPSNQTVLLKSTLFNQLIQVFVNGIDRECSRFVLDTMASLIKVGWTASKDILKRVVERLESDCKEELLSALEIIHASIDEKDSDLAELVVGAFGELSSLLHFNSSEVRESVIQVIGQLVEVYPPCHQLILDSAGLLSRVVAVMNAKHNQKKSKSAVTILLKLSKSQHGARRLACFYNEVLMMAISDEDVGKLATDLLLSIEQGLAN